MSGYQEMPMSWRYLASAGSKLSSLKGYIARDQPQSPSFRGTPPSHDLTNAPTLEAEGRHSWRAWAGQKIRARRRTGDELNTEVVNVFPGWAVRRYAVSAGDTKGPQQFEVEVSVSGYAVSCRQPEQATRSQRAFIHLAKAFASLPKVAEDPTNPYSNASTLSLQSLTPSTEALLAQVQLPPRPDEITEDFDFEELERRLRKARQQSTDTLGYSVNGIPSSKETNDFEGNSCSSSASSTDDLPRTLNGLAHLQQAGIAAAPMPAEGLRRLHANLEQRLQPFWASALPNRLIELRLFVSPHQSPSSSPSSAFAFSVPSIDGTDELDIDTSQGPLDTLTVLTAADGSFTAKFTVPWEKLCQHPLALYIAFGETVVEHDVVLVAQLVPSVPSPSTLQSSSTIPYETYQSPRNSNPSPSYSNPSLTPSNTPLTTVLHLPITHSPIRVVSDIDDTIKFSNILAGAKVVFQNVFVKDVVDSVIPGMGEWYKSMWQRGVRFHYVSNGPFEIINILNEFFQASEIPSGSIKLKSYAGRSLFSGLLSAPAARKRAGVVDILDAFPDSRFFLIGDAGEQDLELYADLAREKPTRILGVFIRDVDTGEYEPLDDPTGWQVMGMGAAGSRPDEYPLVPRDEIDGNSTLVPSPTTTSFPGVQFEQRNHEPLRTQSEPVPPPPSYSETMEFQTPKPNRYAMQGAHATTEPESVDSPMPTIGSYSRMNGGLRRGYQQQTAQGRAQTQSHIPWTRQGAYTPGNDIRTPPNAAFITEPPKPTPPPSITSSGFQSKLRAKLQNSNSSLSYASNVSGFDSSSSLSFRPKGSDPISSADKKRQDLQNRVCRARTQMPSQVALRIFRNPKECVEAEEILGREGVSTLLGADR